MLKVTDTGKGISSEHLAHVFEPFFTTKIRGTGLGLVATYNLVKQHKGFIEVESESGSGTRFQVYFPAETIRDRTGFCRT
ncbi:hypothetical protein KAH55_10995 [bacterium]|nr:hypothetical protein [bacterium]